MSTFRVITADPPWRFGDSLSKMKAATPRSAAANYGTMSVEELKALPVQLVAEDDAVLGLWVPCSMLAEGLAVMSAWGFRQVQEWTWVKLTTAHDEEISVTAAGNVGVGANAALRALARCARKGDRVQFGEYYEYGEVIFDLPLAFGMGRLARSCKETFLVGVRGSPYKHLRNKSIRDVFFAEAGPHSQKPECVQDALEEMFPRGNRLELFARRQRENRRDCLIYGDPWICIGNEAPETMGEDIRDSLKRLIEGATS